MKYSITVYYSGVSLADWLNSPRPRGARAKIEIASYVHWLNSGRGGALPKDARSIFVKPICGRILPHGRNRTLTLVGLGDRNHHLLELAKLTQAGAVDRLRECQNCSRWFFARKDNERKFCGSNCRVKAYISSLPEEKRKAQRRSYMKGYRRDQEERNKKAKKVAKQVLADSIVENEKKLTGVKR